MKIVAYTIVILMIPFWIGIGILWSKADGRKSVQQSAPVLQPALAERATGTRMLTIGDTGVLEETKSGNLHLAYTVVTADGRRVELGVVDTETIVREFSVGYAGVRSINIRPFVGKRITVMAHVEARLHDEKVFEPTWAHFVLIQAHDGVAE